MKGGRITRVKLCHTILKKNMNARVLKSSILQNMSLMRRLVTKSTKINFLKI